MTKASKWLAAWGAAIMAIEAMAAALAPVAIPECFQPPRLDGVLDDPAWQTPAAVAQLYLENTDTPAPDTAVWLARDSQWLYLGFKCLNSNMAHVVQTVFKHDDLYPNFYGNESVEFYIRPDAAQDRYYWFVLSADNVTFENRISAAKPYLVECSADHDQAFVGRLDGPRWPCLGMPLTATTWRRANQHRPQSPGRGTRPVWR